MIRSDALVYVSKAMGRLVGPLSPTNGFHGDGPFRRGVGIRRVTAVSASAISSRARFAPRQKCTPAPKVRIGGDPSRVMAKRSGSS